MFNNKIAEILSEIGIYLEMQDVPFKPRAYEKAAEIINSLGDDVGSIYKAGGIKALENIDGIGLSIASSIEEFLKTGKVKFYEELKKKTPVDLANLRRVEGLGPKKIKALYKKLDIKNLEDLESAAKSGKIKVLDGFGEKTEANILKGIEFIKKSGNRLLLGQIFPEIKKIELELKNLSFVKKINIAGSARRMKETIGDLDILIASDKPEAVMDFFTKMPNVDHILGKGDTKSSVVLRSGLQIDLRVVEESSYGAALNYFTGSKDHNVALRKIAIENNLKLNEYGLFKVLKNGKEGAMIAGKTEEEIYAALNLDYIEPELREVTGEIEAARSKSLPKLISYQDLKGDLQTQTNWTDGENSIEEMASAAIKYGLEYIAITDHTKRLAMTHGLDARRIVLQMKEIDKLNLKLKSKNINFKILKGTECDILKDGSLDLPDEILKLLDVVGVSVHSNFNLPEAEQTERVLKAIKNPHADIFFHPTGRLINKRQPYFIDMDKVIKTAKETGTILEIDALPDRLDLKADHIRKCVSLGVKMSIDSDSHSINHFNFLKFGIAEARRGWAKKDDIINSWSLEKMLGFLKK